MPEIGIQRLGSGHRQEHGTERNERPVRILDRKSQCIDRIDRGQNLRRLDDAHHTQRSQRQEPQEHHRPEHCADACGAPTLNQKQSDQDHQCNRHDEGCHPGCSQGDALDRGQHRNRRGDDRITVKERGSEDTQDCNQPGQDGPITNLIERIGQQGQHAPLASIVEAQDHQHIFERHHDGDRPEHHRQNRVDLLGRELQPMGLREGFLERIQRAGADVTKDDAQSPKYQGRQLLRFRSFHGVSRRRNKSGLCRKRSLGYQPQRARSD